VTYFVADIMAVVVLGIVTHNKTEVVLKDRLGLEVHYL